jgi:hypothetical protein
VEERDSVLESYARLLADVEGSQVFLRCRRRIDAAKGAGALCGAYGPGVECGHTHDSDVTSLFS